MRRDLEENEYRKEDQVPNFTKINRRLFIGQRNHTFEFLTAVVQYELGRCLKNDKLCTEYYTIEN